MATIPVKLTWEDVSTGDQEETGQEIRIFTDSPSFVPNQVIDYQIAAHPWMLLKPIEAGVEETTINLKLPATFVKFQVRQYNADGPGPWSLPKQFALVAPAGGNIPPAPTNLGLAVVTSGGPANPPTDPPPPPPPTGGGSTSSNYVFANQFSGVQSQNQWSYRDSAGSLMSYVAADSIWRGDELYLAIWNGGFRHGSSGSIKDAILRYTVPTSGFVDITGSTGLYDSPGNATFIIKHNATTLFSQACTDTTVYPYSVIGRPVVAGDTIDFISRRTTAFNGNINNLKLAPTINLTTDGTTAVNPTVSSLTPTAFTVPVQGVQSLTVTLSSPAIAIATVTPASSDPTKVTVPASVTIPVGQSSATFGATGVAVGSSTITATYNSSNKTSAATVAAASSGTWPNAPVGGTVLKDADFSNISGFLDVYNSTILTTDATAPLSPPAVIKARIEAFAREGGNQLELWQPVRWREMYMGLYWRTNPQFQGRIVGNKLFFLGATEGMNGVFLFGTGALVNGRGPLQFGANTTGISNVHITGGDPAFEPALMPNVSSGILTVGVWHKIEARIRCSTTRTSRDGILQWWVNGVLAGSYLNYNYCGPNGEGMNRWAMSQTWDGFLDMGRSNTVAWEHYVDHLIIIGKN